MSHVLQRFALPLSVVVAAALAACGSLDLGRAAGVATGLVSHQVCSATFVSRIDPEEFYRQAIEPAVGPAQLLLSHTIDRQQAAVTASFARVVTSRAVYRGPLGCLVLHGPPPPADWLGTPRAGPSLLPPLAGPEVVEPSDPALQAVLDRAFDEPDHPPHRWTKAVVIVHRGRIVAERYAPGYGIETPVTGWSMAKSVINALIGILVREHKLSVDQPAPIAAWSDPTDPRHAITIDHLLRMTSGLDFGQSLISSVWSAFDPAAQMLFDERDMAGFAERARPAAAPGAHWTYTDANTLLLSRILRDQVGGDAASVVGFAHRELFDKLGMRHVTLEFDATGTPIGSSHLWAPARAWARLGLLYLDDGVVGGERLLPEGWVDYSARLTPGSEDCGYGAGFWTNRGASRGAQACVRVGMPAESFMARGKWGQYLVIVPSAQLVLVRLGFAHTPDGDIEAITRLVADAVAAVTAR